jgi:hypothetical protein
MLLSARPVPGLARLLAAAVTALSLVGFALPAGPAQAAGPLIGPQFFGLHHAGLHADGARGWPQTTVGSIRLWDNGVSWREIETAPGRFDWSRLDALVAKARSQGASVLLVLGQTPSFHSTRPTAAGAYGRGASAMPRKAAWVRYVKAVANRNARVWGNSVGLQVWNEANAVPYWSGTPRQMAKLTVWTRAALRSARSSALLVAPAMVTRLSSQQTWLRSFYAQRVNGRNVSAYADALSFQLYPAATGGPESSMSLLRQVRATLARHGIRKPIYNTEVNYGLVGGPQAGSAARQISGARQVGNVIRTYVLNAQNRVSRVYWYSWDLQSMSNTPLVYGDGITATPAGQAFARVQSWLVGSRATGCSLARTGVYSCAFRTGRETRRVVWHPTRTVRVKAPAGTRSFSTASGATRSTAGGTLVRVGPVPVLFRSSR